MIRITSKQHNFRRCGVAHPKGTTEYPDDRFSSAELKVFQAEPKLTVEIVEEKSPAAGAPEDGEQVEGTEEERPDLTVREIKERLEEMGVELPPKVRKEELQRMLAEKLSERVVPE